MKYFRFRYLLFTAFILLMMQFSCTRKKEIDRSFYYWKTNFKFSEEELTRLDDLDINKMYVRFFDVVKDAASQKLIPQSPVQFSNPAPEDVQIVPVVFIDNKAIEKLTSEETTEVSSKIFSLVNEICNSQKIEYKELQFDCDWTDNSREVFFSILKNIKAKIDSEEVILSATIRLHQIKYAGRTGIPPVARGALMFYNMGVFNSDGKAISILNIQEAKNYTPYIRHYKLPLDLALPLYSWGVQFRGSKPIDIIHNFSMDDALASTYLEKISDRGFRAKQNFFMSKTYLMKDDILKIEEVKNYDLLLAARMLRKTALHQNRSVILFDWNTNNLKRFSDDEMDKVFDLFY